MISLKGHKGLRLSELLDSGFWFIEWGCDGAGVGLM
jgi:hypothetical protein